MSQLMTSIYTVHRTKESKLRRKSFNKMVKETERYIYNFIRTDIDVF